MAGIPFSDTEAFEPVSPRLNDLPWPNARSSWWMSLVSILGGMLGGGLTGLIDRRQVGLMILLGLLFSTALLALCSSMAMGRAPGRRPQRLKFFMLGIWFSPLSLPAAASTGLLLPYLFLH
jgi:hypothetical protein